MLIYLLCEKIKEKKVPKAEKKKSSASVKQTNEQKIIKEKT